MPRNLLLKYKEYLRLEKHLLKSVCDACCIYLHPSQVWWYFVVIKQRHIQNPVKHLR